MAFSSVLQMYLGWANSIMCERGVLIEGLHELQDGLIFCHLIELLTGTDLGVGHQNDSDGEEQPCLNNTVQIALDYLQGIGVKVKATAAGVVCGELKSILDVLWAIILHCTIHSPDHPANQRTVRNGRKALLQWCKEELHHSTSLDMTTSMVKNFSHKNLLSDLISVHCSFDSDGDSEDQMVVNLTNAILAAEDHLGISKTLVGRSYSPSTSDPPVLPPPPDMPLLPAADRPSDVINGTVDEHALLIYVALLRRKVTVLMSRTSSLSSLSSNENIAFKIPMNSRHEIMDALHKAHSFRFIRRQRKQNLRKFVLLMRGSKLKKLQEGLFQTCGTSLASIADSSFSSHTSGTSQSPHSRVIAPSDQSSESGSVDTPETQSASYDLSNWPSRASPSVQSSSNGKQFSGNHRPLDEPKDKISESLNDQSQRSGKGQQMSSSHSSHELQDKCTTESTDAGQRSDTGHKDVDAGGGGDAGVEKRSQQSRDVECPLYERQPKPSSKGDGLQTAEDELLGLLEAISLESSHIRHELSESQQREIALKEELDRCVSAAEEHVVSKLVQELEMLRAENRRLFRESANARNSNAHDKRTTEKLQATINKLQNDVDRSNSENFRLNLKIRLLESHKVKVGSESAVDGQESRGRGQNQAFNDQEALQQVAADVFLMDQFLDLPSGSTSEELVQYLSTNQQLLGNFSEVNAQLASKLSELNDELTKLKVSSRQLEQENRLVKMTAETSKLEAETMASRCHRIEDHLSSAQKKNAKLVQELQDNAKHSLPETDQANTFLRLRQLEEENALLKQRMELAEEDKQLLKKELEQYKKNQSSIDAMLKGRSDMSSGEVTEESEDKHVIARERVIQSVLGKSEREAAQTQPPSNSHLHQDHVMKMENKFDDNPLDGDYSRPRTNADKIKVAVGPENSYLKRQNTYDTVAQVHVRKSSLGDLIVAKATNSPSSNEDEMEKSIDVSQSDMSEGEDSALADPKYESINLISYRDRMEMLSKPSATVNGMTDGDTKSWTVKESNIHTEPRETREGTPVRSGHKGSKFSTVNSSMTHLRGITEKAKHDLPSSSDGRQGTQSNDRGNIQQKKTVLPQVFEEQYNPRLARLQALRRSLGIDKSGGNSSRHDSEGGTPGESSEFEIRSRFSDSRRGRIAKWNKFNSYKTVDDLGSSYLDPSSKQSSSVPSIGSSQKEDIKKEKSTLATSLTSLSSVTSGGSQHQRRGLGSVSLDEYVQALKYRVKSLETEADEWSDEYFSLPEHFQEPRRLAERSPKRKTTEVQQVEPLSAVPSSSSEDISSKPKLIDKKEKKAEIVIGKESREKESKEKESKEKKSTEKESTEKENKEKESRERKDSMMTLMPLPNRVSGDGMSDGQAQYGEVITEDEANSDEVTKNENSNETTSESDQIESIPVNITEKSSFNETELPKVEKTSSPMETTQPSNESQVELDSLVQTIISQADSSPSKAGGTDKLHLSNSEESKSYKHKLLKEEDQEYANSIIEKYLEQLSVLPQKV